MGSLIGNLTNSQVTSPTGQTSYSSDPSQLAQQASQQIPAPQGPSLPGVGPLPQGPMPSQISKPSFLQAYNSGPAGTPAPAAGNPSLTKGGKLLAILTGAASGGLSGLAANANTYAATGRNAGFGGGVGAGFTQQLPFAQAQQRQGLEQEQAKTELIKQQGSMVNTPYGYLPVALAKGLFPALIGKEGKVESAQIGAGAKRDVANTAAATAEKVHRYMPIPGVGMFDTQTRQVMPGTEQGVTITPEIAADHSLPEQFIGKPMKLSDLNGMMRFENQQQAPMMTAQGPIVIDKKKKTAVPVTGPGGQSFSPPALASPIQIGDLSNPGQTKVVSAGSAIAQGAPGVASASVEVPKAAAKAEVPTKIGDQKVAFTTMIQHAQLLRDAAKALNNGDVQTLAGLKNKFKNEFGYSGPITATAIADAYKGEVSNVINKGHITDTGNEKIAHTLDPNKQNYATIDSVLSGYQALAQSKMNMLTQQQQNAVDKSQPGKGKPKPPASAPDTADPFAQFGGRAR